jgi:hypothetical protein
MIRYAVLIPILGLALVAAACGDGGSGPAPSPSPTGSPTGEAASSTAAIDETPPTEVTPSVDGETPDIEETPGTTSSPTPAGTPALAPGNLEFDIASELVDCVFDAETSFTDCGDEGTFTIDPPLSGAYTACDLYMLQDQPVMLICSGGENVQPTYYSIPR